MNLVATQCDAERVRADRAEIAASTNAEIVRCQGEQIEALKTELAREKREHEMSTGFVLAAREQRDRLVIAMDQSRAALDRLHVLVERAARYIEADTDPDEQHPEARYIRKEAARHE